MSLIITVIASMLLALAINAASDEDVWPGSFGLIQRHPFAAVAVLATVLLLATGFNFLYERTGLSRRQTPIWQTLRSNCTTASTSSSWLK